MSFVTQLVPVATALTTISLGLYTTILPQSKRPKFFAALIIFACLTWHTSKKLPFTLQFINQFLVAILFYLWHMFNLLFIHGYQIEPSSNSVSILKKLRKAYYMNSNVRWLDTPHEVRDIIGRPTNQFILKKWEDKGEAVNKPLITTSRIHYVLRKIVDLVLFHFLEKLLKDTLHPTVTGHDFMTSRTQFIRRLLFQPNDLYPYKPGSREYPRIGLGCSDPSVD
ncbi:hypothetical protein HYALB_00007283 [Hymenoscyphus albidus]|uniref:Uncharacterized protein n=1 Tax=Hymenoscyphus albidus TaxID=595503 RepID=A0A9N9M1Y8_9HELO|nr:hypothetical protein HYALB_00007283 [Hymenoscyphus albidus]